MAHSSPKVPSPEAHDPLALDGIDHLELFVGNARQALFFYSRGLGFTPIAYRGPETGWRDSASYVLQQGDARLVLTSTLKAGGNIPVLLDRHGDTVRSIALSVPDCTAYYQHAISRGATSVEVPARVEDEEGFVLRAAIATYGDVIHPIIERKAYQGRFFPGFRPYEDFFPAPAKDLGVGVLGFDHFVGNVELGKMDPWVKFYETVLGFTQMQKFTDEDIATEYSALMSRVMRDGSGKVKFPINEPAKGKRKSQIEEYLDFHGGPGVQHIALLTLDIVHTVRELRERGLSFLAVPKSYYDEIPSRVGTIKENLKTIGELGILVDRDADGYLLQLFTKPVQDRPTLFFELIQREGSHGFGIGNFKALFEAIEREQALRGNL